MKKRNNSCFRFIVFFIWANLMIILSQNIFAQEKIIQPKQQHSKSFAIIIDDQTYTNIEQAVDTYRDAVENDGLSTYILINNWKNPDEIKKEIIKLYNGNPKLEGVVFIGDIPIPMIRNAQYMTSAFKLDEDRFQYFKSSVPSDCFYDDFDLKFNFIGHDSVHKLAYYYSLSPESPQRINKEIYSGRIKPSGLNINKYNVIKNYLLRITEQKKKQNFLRNAFVFTGHGYNSQSLPAWADERLSLQEQFPQLYKPSGRMKILRFNFSDDMKNTIKTELQMPDLDMAIFHAHGEPDLQLLLSYPPAISVDQNIKSIKIYLRNKLRSARSRNKSIADTKEYFMKKLNIPQSWFDGAFIDSIAAADSIRNYNLDMHIEDVRKMSPQAKFIMLDECFNGSFHLNKYIAGEYVFGKGNVIAAEANTVNTLQDRWADEYLGLLNEGVRIGEWHRLKNSLESVIIGDPTFHYSVVSKINLGSMLISNENNLPRWKELTLNRDPVVRNLAIGMVYKNLKSKYEEELVKIYRNDPSPNVRLGALKCLAEIDGKGFRNILKESINDPYEYIRRLTAIWMGEIGDREYIPLLIKQIIFDESQRVSFDGKNSLAFFDYKETLKELNKIIDSLLVSDSRQVLKKKITSFVKRNEVWLYKEILPALENDTINVKKREREVQIFRNYKFHEAVPRLIALMNNPATDKNIRIKIAEALGWFNLSYQKNNILLSCKHLIKNKQTTEKLREELIRTKNRLIDGLNDVMLP